MVYDLCIQVLIKQNDVQDHIQRMIAFRLRYVCDHTSLVLEIILVHYLDNHYLRPVVRAINPILFRADAGAVFRELDYPLFPRAHPRL